MFLSKGVRHFLSPHIRVYFLPNINVINRDVIIAKTRFLGLPPSFHSSCKLEVKKFSDSENDFAREILQQNAAGIAVKTLQSSATNNSEQPEFQQITDWHSLSGQDLLIQFGQVVEICRQNEICISDRRFDQFVEALVNRIASFSDEQLIESLRLLVELGPTPAVNTRNFLDIWKALDQVCLKRITTWKTDELLHMADQWYPLRLSKIGRFVHKAVWKISTRLRKLNKDQLLRTVFYINLTRTPVENMVDIEISLKQNFFLYGVDDVAVLCMGFFKTETPVRSVELIERIYQLTIQNAKEVKDISLTAILKLLRYSSRIPNVQSMDRLLTALTPEIPRLSLLACLHLALLGTDVHLCHQPSLQAIFERFLNDIKLLRLKDMERIAFVATHYNMDLPGQIDRKLLQAILEELPNRVKEITDYPKCYLALLNFLSLKEVYSEQLIRAAFEPRFLALAYGRNITAAGREVVALDAFLRINLRDKNYQGNYFPEKPFKIISKLKQDYVPSLEYRLTKSDRMLLEIQQAFQRRHEFAHIIHVLPHYQRPDVIMLWDGEKSQFLDVCAKCPPQYSGVILSREHLLADEVGNENLRLIAIVAGSWNCYVRDQNRITGGFAMKLKQLGLIGFETVVIPWYEWPMNTIHAKESYLFNKIDKQLVQR
ncbi:uncharacterized protein LOC131681507 [Topomyia yanbarensis]|uniref:uncharacterized protein LOC131681507 n=1 Tax=Topomyia yanbarensis TaxID=2498891 RepID=UPI00273BF2D8|nr:uncharacterized protein LOC131681507 [Topomyia yanbarensis]